MKRGELMLDEVIDFKKRFEQAKKNDGPIDNWLWELAEGTQFLCRPLHQPGVSDDLEFHLLNKRFFPVTGKASCRLKSILNNDIEFWKNPIKFVAQFELVGILDGTSNKVNEK